MGVTTESGKEVLVAIAPEGTQNCKWVVVDDGLILRIPNPPNGQCHIYKIGTYTMGSGTREGVYADARPIDFRN